MTEIIYSPLGICSSAHLLTCTFSLRVVCLYKELVFFFFGMPNHLKIKRNQPSESESKDVSHLPSLYWYQFDEFDHVHVLLFHENFILCGFDRVSLI